MAEAIAIEESYNIIKSIVVSVYDSKRNVHDINTLINSYKYVINSQRRMSLIDNIHKLIEVLEKRGALSAYNIQELFVIFKYFNLSLDPLEAHNNLLNSVGDTQNGQERSYSPRKPNDLPRKRTNYPPEEHFIQRLTLQEKPKLLPEKGSDTVNKKWVKKQITNSKKYYNPQRFHQPNFYSEGLKSRNRQLNRIGLQQEKEHVVQNKTESFESYNRNNKSNANNYNRKTYTKNQSFQSRKPNNYFKNSNNKIFFNESSGFKNFLLGSSDYFNINLTSKYQMLFYFTVFLIEKFCCLAHSSFEFILKFMSEFGKWIKVLSPVMISFLSLVEMGVNLIYKVINLCLVAHQPKKVVYMMVTPQPQYPRQRRYYSYSPLPWHMTDH